MKSREALARIIVDGDAQDLGAAVAEAMVNVGDLVDGFFGREIGLQAVGDGVVGQVLCVFPRHRREVFGDHEIGLADAP